METTNIVLFMLKFAIEINVQLKGICSFSFKFYFRDILWFRTDYILVL